MPPLISEGAALLSQITLLQPFYSLRFNIFLQENASRPLPVPLRFKRHLIWMEICT